jgi:hypothetical protein
MTSPLLLLLLLLLILAVGLPVTIVGAGICGGR